MSKYSFLFLGFCHAENCHAEASFRGGYCFRHAGRYFEPGTECAWCGASLDEEPGRCRNLRDEAFCRPGHRSASNRALRRFLERIA